MIVVEETKIWRWKMRHNVSVVDQSECVRMDALEPAGEGWISDSWLAKSVSEVDSSEYIFKISSA